MPPEKKTVYIVMRPLDRFRDKMLELRKKAPSVGQVVALNSLLVLQHWAICIGDNNDEYYHLKKLENSEIALDVTPFDPATVLMKVPVWETDYSESERLGLAAAVIAAMRGEKPQQSAHVIPIHLHGKELLATEIKAIYNRYRPRIAFLTTPKALFRTGKYNPVNFCWHFVGRFWFQVAAPQGISLDWVKAAAGTVGKFPADLLKAAIFRNSPGEFVHHFLTIDIEKQ
ncbi:hypothetical protein H0H93_007108 [Arthromyces matolae]|nr:hypothetical protein H0H93_007108 [Arthromyces matolae]